MAAVITKRSRVLAARSLSTTLRSAVVLLGVIGCGSELGSTDADDGPAVAVIFQGDPLADVQVSLYGPTGDAALARAITGEDGKAYFTDIPSPEPPRYRVGLESLGDGGWMLDPKVIEPFCDSQAIMPLHESASQELVLPDRAVRSLNPNRRS